MVDSSRNIQLVAWAVLMAAFGAFLAVIIGGPVWAGHFVQTAMAAQKGQVESKAGSVVLEAGGNMRVLAAGDDPAELGEGWTVETLPGTEAFVDLSDRDARPPRPGPTLHLEAGTWLEVRQLRRPRFAISQAARRVALAVRPGGVGEAGLAAGTTWDAARLEIATPFGRVDVAPRSRARLAFSAEPRRAAGTIEVMTPTRRLRVIGIEGAVTVTNASGWVVLGPAARSDVYAHGPPSRPVIGPENVMPNGRFRTAPEAGGWEFGRYAVADAPTLGQATHEILRGGRSVIRFRRVGAAGTSADLFYMQDLDVDVRHARAISVTAELRVINQSLPGGGLGGPEGASEYPLILRLRTADADGNACEWPVGFYALPPDPGSAYRTDNGVSVPLESWFTFQSGNLLDAANPFAFANRFRPCARPARLLRVEVRASGHDYESEIDTVEVWVVPN